MHAHILHACAHQALTAQDTRPCAASRQLDVCRQRRANWRRFSLVLLISFAGTTAFVGCLLMHAWRLRGVARGSQAGASKLMSAPDVSREPEAAGGGAAAASGGGH